MAQPSASKKQSICPIDITQAELATFHKIHFSASSTVHFAACFLGPAGEDVRYEEDDDDGLGYYEDGVKRTLTDEQIAIFRHSEIEALARAKRHAEQEEDLPVRPTSSTKTSVQQEEPYSAEKSAGDHEESTALRSSQLQVPNQDPVAPMIGPMPPASLAMYVSDTEVKELVSTPNASTSSASGSLDQANADKVNGAKARKKKSKSRHPGQRGMHTKPDLRKRTWDKVEQDTTGELDY